MDPYEMTLRTHHEKWSFRVLKMLFVKKAAMPLQHNLTSLWSNLIPFLNNFQGQSGNHLFFWKKCQKWGLCHRRL